MIKNIFQKSICLALFLSFVSLSFAQNESSKIEGLRQGILPNGLTYYIMKSNLQKGEVSFYLIQKAGAILEDDNENGLAHFLEHMCFGGSNHFPDGIKSYMNSQGITKFNAFTSQDETVYNVDDVKTADPQLVDTCLFLLRDWCGSLLLKSDAIDKQRGVITEEWRTRQTLQKRRQEAMAPYIFNYSQYSKRDVIGSMDIIRNFKPKTLENFYKKWYRSDLQGVIIVGDIDPNLIEEKVKTIFGDLYVPKGSPERKVYNIEDQSDVYYTHFVDNEIKRNSISIYGRELYVKSSDATLQRQERQIRNIFNELSGQRLVKFRNSNDAEFFTADISYQKLVKDYYLSSVTVIPFPGMDSIALKQVMTVYEQINRFGFTEKEVEEQKKVIYNQLQEAKKSVSDLKNTIYVNKMKSNFLDGSPISDVSEGIKNLEESLLEIDVDQVNNWIKKRNLRKNTFIEVESHDTKKNVLSKEQVLNICNSISASDLKKEVFINTDTIFMDFIPVAGNIVKIDTLKNYDAEVWHLSNGAKMIYKYTKEGRGSFGFSSNTLGGKSLLPASDLPSATALSNLATRSGIYTHNKNAMNAMLKNKNMDLSMNLQELQQGISGGSPVKHSNLFFQAIYLFLTNPRFDISDYNKFIQKEEYKLSTQEPTPLDIISDSIHQITTKANDRDWKFDDNFISAMNFDSMKRIFNELFMNNTGNFTYYIVGDLSKDEAKDLTCRYIASLPPSSNPRKSFILRDFSVDDSIINRNFSIDMPGNKSLVNISYLNRLELNHKEKLIFSVLVGTLRNRYFNTIRETEGGSYGVNVQPKLSDYPENRQQLNIIFETQSGKQDALKPLVFKEIDDIKMNSIHQFELEEAIINMKNSQERSMEHLGINYWMNVLANFEERNVDITSKDRFEKYIDTINLDDVKDLANKFFSTAKLRDIVVSSIVKEEVHYKH